jgi:hyperosmotically inducible protein
LRRRRVGDLMTMPTPLNIITKPLQIGAQIAFGAIQGIQQALQGQSGSDEPPPRPEPRSEPQPAPRQPKPKPKPLDDVTITRKVETVLFRDDSVDKGKISVNTADGVVWLRGEAKTPEQINQLKAKVQEIPEVKEVESLLHLPKTPPPRKARRPKAAPKRTPKRTTAERKPRTKAAERSPKDLAGKRQGRQPAPLGAKDESA